MIVAVALAVLVANICMQKIPAPTSVWIGGLLVLVMVPLAVPQRKRTDADV